MPTYQIKQGTTLPTLRVQLLDGANNPVNISTATSVLFRMSRNPGTTPLIDASASNLDDGTEGLRGYVEYAWQAGDTDVPGNYVGEFIVDFGSASEGFPASSTGLVIAILDNLAG